MRLSRAASVFAVYCGDIKLYDWSGAPLGRIEMDNGFGGMHFTPCGKYLVVQHTFRDYSIYAQLHQYSAELHQYDVATMSCVRVMPKTKLLDCVSFVISPCSRVVMWVVSTHIATAYLYPHNSE